MTAHAAHVKGRNDVQVRTQEALAQLEQAEWFRAVGQQDTAAAIVLSSWDDAVASCASPVWQDLLLEAANRYREQLVRRSRDRFQEWNVIAQAVKQVTVPLVERKIAPVVQAHTLPKIVADTVQWDIALLAMEAEFADVYPPGFFASQAYWYIQGHFPCGWRGRFPDGQLVIY